MDNVNRYSNEIIQTSDRRTGKQSHTFSSYRCHTESEGMLDGWRKEQMGNPYLTA